MITGFTGKVFATSPLVAEAMALREAISLAANLSIENVLLESDSLDLINACRGETEIGEIRNIVQDVKHMRMSFRKCGFTWIHRSGNNLAHTLAQKVQRNLIPPPIGLRFSHKIFNKSCKKRDQGEFKKLIL